MLRNTHYGDLDYRVTRAACTVKIAPANYAQINAIKQDLMPRFLSWWRLQGSCSSVSGCLTFLGQKVAGDVSAADSRDVSAVRANERLSTANQAARTAKSVDDIESGLIAYWGIADDLRLAGYRRSRLGKTAIANASVALDSAEGTIGVARGSLSNDSIADNLSALNGCKTASSALGMASGQLTTAVVYSSASDPDVLASKQRISSDQQQINDIQAAAGRNIEHIRHKIFIDGSGPHVFHP